MTQAYGATRDEWNHLIYTLGLGEDLLPVVSNPDAEISPNSTMKDMGKTPSLYNRQGHVVGISEWTASKATPEQLDRWSSNDDYGICLIGREVRALDIDIDNTQIAKDIKDEIFQIVKQHLPLRQRANSGKCLLAFKMPGECPKRKITTDYGIIEFLGEKQQFIACGTHKSGVRYEWAGGLPDDIPTLEPEVFERVWARLAECYAIAPPEVASKSVKQQKLTQAQSNDPIAKHLSDSGFVKSTAKDGSLHITCPFESEHTTDSAESSTVYYPAFTGGYQRGHFHCLHGHCAGRKRSEYLLALGIDESENDFSKIDSPAPNDVVTDGTPATKTSTEGTGFMSINEFDNQKAPDWLIQDFMPSEGLACIYGESGSGKTFLALDLALTIATGREWNGRRVKQGKVAYIAAEDAAGVRHRIRAYLRKNKIKAGDVPMGVASESPNFTDKAEVKKVLGHMRAFAEAGDGAPISVCFIDTLAQVTAGADENSGKDMGKVLDYCKQLHAATGALMVLIHHSGKDASKGARGWSGIRGAADCMLEVVRFNDQREVVVQKLKNSPDGARFGFRLETVVVDTDEDGDPVTSCVVEYVAAKTRTERKAEAKPLGKHEQAAMDILNDMCAGGEVMTGHWLDAIKAAMPAPESGKQDKRKWLAERTKQQLEDRGRVEIAGNYVSLAA
jgi:hypothetical protein